MKNDCVGHEQLFAMAQGTLSGWKERRLRAHVEKCASCRHVLESYQSLDAVLDEWRPAAEPSAWFDARVRAAVAAVEAARPSRGYFGLLWNHWLATPALAALLVVSTMVAIRNVRPPSTQPAANTGPAASAGGTQAPEVQTADQELKMYQNLPMLEDYDMLSDFDVISELPKGKSNLAD